MKYKIVTSSRASTLTDKVNELIAEGWEIVGSHSVVEKHRQNRFSGMQHRDTEIESEYSQTIIHNG